MSNLIYVGCKLPTGLVLKVGNKTITLKGANDARIIGGYGITPVPSDFWEAWEAEYKESPFIIHNLIFAQTTVARAEGTAKEQEGVKTNFEPLKTETTKAGEPITRR